MKVNCKVSINAKAMINELPETWNHQDYLNILDLVGFDAAGMAESEIKEMAMMSLADQEPEESAGLILKYRLSEKLSEGQIQQLSHEMQEDKVSEEYPDIFLHEALFNVNQLLFKSFNGKFPNAHAIALDLDLRVKPANCMEQEEQVPAIIIQALAEALGEHSAIARLYEDEISGRKAFTDAKGILWKFSKEKTGDNTFHIRLFSSEYWLHDLPNKEVYETTIKLFEAEEGED